MLTRLGQWDAHGEYLRSKIDSIALNEFVFAPDEEIFMDATEIALPSPGQAWSSRAYYVDGAQRSIGYPDCFFVEYLSG